MCTVFNCARMFGLDDCGIRCGVLSLFVGGAVEAVVMEMVVHFRHCWVFCSFVTDTFVIKCHPDRRTYCRQKMLNACKGDHCMFYFVCIEDIAAALY